MYGNIPIKKYSTVLMNYITYKKKEKSERRKYSQKEWNADK